VSAPRCPFHVRGECLNRKKDTGNGKKSALQNNTNSSGIPIASVPYIFTSRQKQNRTVRPSRKCLVEKMFASDALRQIAHLSSYVEPSRRSS